MKKIFAIALVFSGAFLFASTVRAQNFIAITATVTDPNGIPYGNGTMSAVLTPGSPGGWTLGGQPYSGRVGPVTLDSAGKFTANFGNNSVILPAGTKWQITVNSNQGGIAPPFGTGAQTFTVIMTLNSTQDISTTLNAAAPKLTNFSGAGTGTIAGTVSAFHIPYASGPNTLADIIGSAVTGVTGAIALTAGADSTTPLSIAGHSATQSAPIQISGDPTASFDAFTQGFLTSPFDKQSTFRALNQSHNFFAGLGVVVQDNAFDTSVGGYQAFQAVFEANPTANVTTPISTSSSELYINNATGNFGAAATVAAQFNTAQIDSNVNVAGEVDGTLSTIQNNGTSNTIARAAAFHTTIGNAAGTTMTEADGFLSDVPASGTSGVGTWAGYHFKDAAGVGTNTYGVLIDPITAGATHWAIFNLTGKSRLNALSADTYSTVTNCAANGTAANPSVVSCAAASAGMFSCATAASTGTCQVNTTAVTANSEIFITQDQADGGAGQLNVTCNTGADLPAAAPILRAKSAGASFTINLGTVSVNPACFEYHIVN